jgi:hypothetical protein
LIEKLRPLEPMEADALLGCLHLHKRRQAEAAAAFESLFLRLREDPWANPSVMTRSLTTVEHMAGIAGSEFAERMFKALSQRFAASCNDRDRLMTRFALARALERDDPGPQTFEAVQAFEPFVPWREDFLKARAQCYAQLKHPRASAAESDLNDFLRNEMPPWYAPTHSPAK